MAVSGVTDLIAAALAAQSASGAFLSTVHVQGEPRPDENAFVTALVVHELLRCEDQGRVGEAIERALDFLLTCEVEERPGHFCFYPATAHPSWLPVHLPPDADDTALCAALLVRCGRRPPSLLTDVVERVLAPFRLRYVSEASEPWHRVGVYLTWLRAGYARNVVDCCVNVNVLALLQQAGLAGAPSFNAIVEMIDAALEYAGQVMGRARMLSPWYPHPCELVHAVERAIEFGVDDLRPALEKMHAASWGRSEVPGFRTPVCGSLDGRIVWTCEALQGLRVLHR
jgi:hypothetical protein